MNPYFQEYFNRSIFDFNFDSKRLRQEKKKTQENAISVEELDDFATKTWNKIAQFIVQGQTVEDTSLSDGIKDILRKSNLIVA